MKKVFADPNSMEHYPGLDSYAITASPYHPRDTFTLGEEVEVEGFDHILVGTVSGLMDRGCGFFLEILIPDDRLV